MHIAFFVHDIHLGGGGERVTVNLANAFVERGYQVSIISMYTPGDIVSLFTLNKEVEISYLNVSGKINLVDKVAAIIAMNRFLAGKKYDYVLGIGNYPSLVLSLVFTHQGMKIIGCMHLSINAIPVFWKLMARLFFRRLDVLVSLTQFDVKYLEGLNSTVCVIPNSTSFHTTQYSLLNDKVVLALGRFVDEKNFETMIHLFGLFCEKRKDWILKIRGAGPLKAQLENLVKKKGLTANILILPPTTDVETEYLSSSVVLLTSKYEGLPMVLIEAQTFGVPVISFDCETGPADIIQDGVSGYLIDPLRKEDLVTKLIELTSDDELRKKMGRNAKLNSARFSKDTIVNQWIDLFQSLQKK
jgi:glycosyltransferase involved in cell wall biosynthesis